jgi:hypothetical protein
MGILAGLRNENIDCVDSVGAWGLNLNLQVCPKGGELLGSYQFLTVTILRPNTRRRHVYNKP